MKTMMNIKIDKDLKVEAQRVTADLGLSLSLVVSNYLKTLVQDRKVVFEESYEPNKETAKILEYSMTKKAMDEAIGFETSEEMDKYLMSL